jgi:hypothetical protein
MKWRLKLPSAFTRGSSYKNIAADTPVKTANLRQGD